MQPLISGIFTQGLVSGVDKLIPLPLFNVHIPVVVCLVLVYALEPVITSIYVENIIKAFEKAHDKLRQEAFGRILQKPIGFFDSTSSSNVVQLLTQDLNKLREKCFGNVSRDRGLRALMEVTGSIVVLFALAPALAPLQVRLKAQAVVVVVVVVVKTRTRTRCRKKLSRV